MNGWILIPEQKNVCALSCFGDYVISHRPSCFTVSYRPAGKHFHIGQFNTLNEAKEVAESYENNPNAKQH